MSKRGWVLLFVLLLPLIEAQGETVIGFTFVDTISKEIISDAFVKFEVDGETYNYYLGKEEVLKINLKEGDYPLKFLVNKPLTEGYDYYGVKNVFLRENQIQVIYTYPGGSLSGSVKDRLNTALPEADLKFDCNKAISIDYPKKTDQFGSFSLEYAPIGVCKIYANFEDHLGMQEVEIRPGVKTFIDIKLDTVVANPNQNNFLFLGGLLFALLILAVVLFRYKDKIRGLTKKRKQEEKEIKSLKEEIKEIKNLDNLGPRGKDIFKTLRKNEKIIVEFLTEQKEPVYFSKIHYKTGLSKGSLSRNVKSLESKDIVKTFKEGKIRRIKLSEWFLEP